MPYGLIAPGVSLVLGIIFILTSDCRPAGKFLVACVFAAGVYFQFFSGFYLLGLLIQSGLAIGLLFWMKLA